VFAGIKLGIGKDVKNICGPGEEIGGRAGATEVRDEPLEQFQTSVLQPVLREWPADVHHAAPTVARPPVDRYRRLRGGSWSRCFVGHQWQSLIRGRRSAGGRWFIYDRSPIYDRSSIYGLNGTGCLLAPFARLHHGVWWHHCA